MTTAPRTVEVGPILSMTLFQRAPEMHADATLAEAHTSHVPGPTTTHVVKAK
jgi:hypothetical protein